MAVVALLCLVYAQPEQEDMQYLQMRRTACVILSRIHSNQEKGVIEEVIQGLEPNDQQKYINKVYATAVDKCESEITQQEVQSVPHLPFSFTSKARTSTPSHSSLSLTVWTTRMLPTTLQLPKSKMPSLSSSRSLMKKTRSETRREKPRKSRSKEFLRATR